MSDEKNSSAEESNDPKAKFREALKKKKGAGGIRNNNIAGNSRVNGGQTSGNTQKMFRRKSGSA